MKIAAVLNLESDMAAVLRGIATELRSTNKLMETATKVAGKLAEALAKAPSTAGFTKIDDAILKTKGLFEELTKSINDFQGKAASVGGGVGGGGATPPPRPGPRAIPPYLMLPAPSRGGGLVPFSGEDEPFWGAAGPSTMPPLSINRGAAGGFSIGNALNIAFVADMVLHGVGHLVVNAASYNDELAVMRQRGVSQADIDAAEATLFGATKIPGVTMADAARHLSDLRSVLGESPGEDKLAIARDLLPHVEKVARALAASTGETGDTSMHMLMRSVEMMGGAIDPVTHKISPERFTASLDAAEQALLVVAKIGKANDFFQMMKQGSMVAKTMDPREFFGMILAPLLDQGGSRTGTALQALGRQFFGGIMTGKVATEMQRLHLFRPGDFEHIRGGIQVTDKGFAHLAEELKGGFFDFFDKEVRPALIKQGITSEDAQTRELYRMLSTDTGRKLGSLFLTQADQARKERGLYNEVPSIDEQLRIASSQNIGFNQEALAAASNFFQILGKENSGAIIAALQAATGFFNMMNDSQHTIHALKKESTGQQLNSFWHWFTDPGSWNPLNRKFWVPGLGHTSPVQQESYRTGDAAPIVHLTVKNYVDGKEMASQVIKTIVERASGPISGIARTDGRRLYSTANA